MARKSVKSLIKSLMPAGIDIYRKGRQIYSERKPMETVFTEIYQKNVWTDKESISGPGSTLIQTEVIRHELPILLRKISAESMLDAPCGDFNWMKEVDLKSLNYTGADIVSDLIENNQKLHGSQNKKFVKLDLTKDELPQVDLIFCRDCLFHLSDKSIFDALRNFKRSKSKYLLTTTFPLVRDNANIPTGGWRPLNLGIAPFNLPEALQMIDEKWVDEGAGPSGKHLGLWKLSNISLPDGD